MSEKIYTKNGYKIIYKKFMYVFNEDLKNGYDWFVSSSACEKGQAIGIKRKDKDKTVTHVNSLNCVRSKYCLY